MGDNEPLRLFLSYARDDQALVEAVERDLEGDFDVWIDRQLSGGQQWWEVILSQIQRCDALLLICTPNSLKSIACLAEMRYANELRRVVIPLRCVEDGVDEGTSPTPLPTLQWLSYLDGNKEEYRTLLRALRNVERRPLPDELPESPKVPQSYVVELAEMLEVEDLDRDMQYEIMRRLEDKYDDVANHERLIHLIERLREKEIFITVDRRCVRLLEDIQSYRAEHVDPSVLPDPPADPKEAFRARARMFLADEHLSIPERDSLHEDAQRLGLSDAEAEALLVEVARTAPGAEARRERYRTTVRRTIEAHGHPLPPADEADLRLRRVDLLIDVAEADKIQAAVVAEWSAEHREMEAEPAPEAADVGSLDHGLPVTAVAASASTASIATAGQDLRLLVWSQTDRRPRSMWQLPGPAQCVSMGARHVAAATHSSCYVYDAASGNVQAVLMPGKDKKTWVTQVLVGPNDDVVVAGAHNGAVEAWSPGDWQSLGKVKQRSIGAPITCLALHPPDREILIGTASGDLWVWGVGGAPLRRFDHEMLAAPVDVAAASRDGSLVVVGAGTGVLLAVDRLGGTRVWQSSIDGPPLAAGVSSQDDAIVVVSKSGTVWRAGAAGLGRCRLPVDAVVGAAVLADDRVLVVDSTGSGRVFAVHNFDEG